MLDLEGSLTQRCTNPLLLALVELWPFVVVLGELNRSSMRRELSDRRRPDLLLGEPGVFGRLAQGSLRYRSAAATPRPC